MMMKTMFEGNLMFFFPLIAKSFDFSGNLINHLFVLNFFFVPYFAGKYNKHFTTILFLKRFKVGLHSFSQFVITKVCISRYRLDLNSERFTPNFTNIVNIT